MNLRRFSIIAVFPLLSAGTVSCFYGLGDLRDVIQVHRNGELNQQVLATVRSRMALLEQFDELHQQMLATLRSRVALLEQSIEYDEMRRAEEGVLRRRQLIDSLRGITVNYMSGAITRNRWDFYVSYVCALANIYYRNGSFGTMPFISEVKGMLETETPLNDRVFIDSVYSRLAANERAAIEKGSAVIAARPEQVRKQALEKNIDLLTKEVDRKKVTKAPQSFISKYCNVQTFLAIACIGAYLLFTGHNMQKNKKSQREALRS